ncbi:hypothetical protein L7F22_013542 [Adiantum nelumboides]|nr:hypothetical protein [Adiantum nelumboides]
MESASNWLTNALKEIAELQYSNISRIDAMSSAIVPDNFPQSKSPFIADDLEDAFNPSLRWGNLAKNLSAPHTCGEMVCQLSNPEDYLWQGFMDDVSMPYDEQMVDELDFNLANAFIEPDSISDSEPEVFNKDDEVGRLNPVKVETDDIKVEEPSTSAFTSSTSLKRVSKIGDITIIDIDRLNQEHVWKVFEFIYNSVHYGVRYKELTQREAETMITAGFQAKVRAESSSSSSPTTTSRSEELEPSCMKKRKPSTLNLSKKEQRDYRPIPLFSNMVEQAEEIAKTEEWRRMIHPGLRQNQGNPPSSVIQQTASTDFAITKTAAKPSPSVVEKQLEKERQDRYCAEEHQLKALQAMFSALDQNGVTVLTKEQVAEKELKYSESYILPPANAKLQPIESASNWHTNALKEIAKLQYNIISRVDAMVKGKQSATPSTSAAPPSTASQQLVPLNYNTSASSSILPRMFLALQSSAILSDNFPQSKSPSIANDLEDAFNPSLRWGNLAKNLFAPHHRYTCGEMVCQLSNLEGYLWQGFMDDASMPYDEQTADELDFNLANAFPEPDSISNSGPEVINEDDEVNPIKMETDDVKVEESSTSVSTSSTSLKGVSKI